MATLYVENRFVQMAPTVIALPKQRSLSTRVVRSAVGGLLTSILANGFLFIGQLIIPRILTREGYAQFTVSISFVALLALFADLGITPMLMREFAGADEDAKHGVDRRGVLLGSALVLRLALAVVVGAAVMVLAPLFYSPDMVTNMAIVLISLIISSRLFVLRSVGEAFVRAHGRYYLTSTFALIDAIVFAVLLIIYRSGGGVSVAGVLWIYVLCNVPGCILLAVWMVRWLRSEGVTLQVDPIIARRLLVTGAPLSVGTAFLTIHNQADTLLLDRLSSAYEVSSFAAMIRLSAAVLPIPAVLGGVVAPELTKLLRRQDYARSRRLIELGLRVLLIAAGTIALFLLPSSTKVAELFLGAKYVASGSLLKLVGWMLVPIFVSSFAIEMSVAAGKFWPITAYTAYIMVAVIVGDVLLIPTRGAEGAMISKLIAVASGCILLVLLLRKMPFLDIGSLMKHAALVLIAVVIAVGAGTLARGYITQPLLLSAMILIAYFTALLTTGAIRLSELVTIRAELREHSAE